jgi:hypothetical protein
VFLGFQIGKDLLVNIRKVIERRFRRHGKGVNAAGDVSAVISANVGQGSTRSHVSTRSHKRIVQRSGRTHVHDGSETTQEGSQTNADRGNPDRI